MNWIVCNKGTKVQFFSVSKKDFGGFIFCFKFGYVSWGRKFVYFCS